MELDFVKETVIFAPIHGASRSEKLREKNWRYPKCSGIGCRVVHVWWKLMNQVEFQGPKPRWIRDRGPLHPGGTALLALGAHIKISRRGNAETRDNSRFGPESWTAPHLLSVPVLPFSSGFLVRDDEGHTGCGCAQQRPPRRLETGRSLLQRRLPSRRQHHHPTHIRRRPDR